MKQENTQTRNSLLQKLEAMHTYEAILETDKAFKNSLLLVSLTVNIVVFIAWIAVQIS